MGAEPIEQPTTTLVLASRTYQPLSDLEAHVAGALVAFGAAPIALRAERLGAKRKPLETTRATLLDLATEPGARVVMFVARDPDTKQPTAGMAGIQRLLAEKGIPFAVVSSPFPGRICALLSEFAERTEKAAAAVDTAGGKRKLVLTQKALELAARVADERDAYAAKLEEGKGFGVGDPALDDKYCGWVRIYCALCDALERAKGLLT